MFQKPVHCSHDEPGVDSMYRQKAYELIVHRSRNLRRELCLVDCWELSGHSLSRLVTFPANNPTRNVTGFVVHVKDSPLFTLGKEGNFFQKRLDNGRFHFAPTGLVVVLTLTEQCRHLATRNHEPPFFIGLTRASITCRSCSRTVLQSPLN